MASKKQGLSDSVKVLIAIGIVVVGIIATSDRFWHTQKTHLESKQSDRYSQNSAEQGGEGQEEPTHDILRNRAVKDKKNQEIRANLEAEQSAAIVADRLTLESLLERADNLFAENAELTEYFGKTHDLLAYKRSKEIGQELEVVRDAACEIARSLSFGHGVDFTVGQKNTLKKLSCVYSMK
ncbi:MAG: hypothetical protein NT025_05735 [bacterium]|nr:hypothetical protein [bacterium]